MSTNKGPRLTPRLRSSRSHAPMATIPFQCSVPTLIIDMCSLPSLQISDVSDNNETPHMILKSFLILVSNLPTTIAAEKFTHFKKC